MAKLVLTDVTSGYSTPAAINANNAAIETAVENTLSRNGTSPNEMNANLDMNSYRIINLPNAVQNQEPITLAQAASIAGVTNPLTQESVAAVLYPQTSVETTAEIEPTNYHIPSHEVCGYFLPERYGTNTTPGTTVMQTAVEAAISLASAAGGGAVLLSDRYKMSTALAGAAGVDLIGTGEGASLEFSGTHGITLGWLTGFGSVTYDNFQLIGGGSGDWYGIYQAGTLDDADELYGLTISRLLITGWNVGIKTRTVRNMTVTECWIQDHDRGIELIGKNLAMNFNKNRIVKGNGGGGTGASASFVLDSFNYTGGTGVVPPEGIQILNNFLYGSDTAVSVTFCNVLNVSHNDINAVQYGVDFTTAQLSCNICDNFFDMNGASVVNGIYGRGLASAIQTKVNIQNNTLLATSVGASAIGIKINDSGNQNQNFVSVNDNYLAGDWDGGDIVFNNAGPGAIFNNRCESTTPTNSISIPNVVTGTVFVYYNLCTKALNYTAAEQTAGEVVIGPNTVSATTRLNFPGFWTTPAYSSGNFTANGTMTWTVASGDVLTYAYEIVGNKMTVAFNIATSTVGGTPNSQLKIAIPASKVATKTMHTVVSIIDNNVRSTGTAIVLASGTTIDIERTDAANWSAATDTTYVRGQIAFEIN